MHKYFGYLKDVNKALYAELNKKYLEGYSIGKDEGQSSLTDSVFGRVLLLVVVFLTTGLLTSTTFFQYTPEDLLPQNPETIEFNFENLISYGFYGIFGSYKSAGLKIFLLIVFFIVSIIGRAIFANFLSYISSIICAILIWGIILLRSALSLLFATQAFLIVIMLFTVIMMFMINNSDEI